MIERKWAVFISGTGSNLQAALDLPEEITVSLVVSSKDSAFGITRARRAGIPVVVLPKKIDWDQLDKTLREYGITSVFLAGFMRIVPPEFVQKWAGKILNVHPSLLPEFPGLNSIQRAHDAGGPYGVTVHEVTDGVDEGPIVYQRKVNVPQLASLEEVEFLYHVSEHLLVRESLRKWKRAPMS